jgi:hypothetical protein
LPRSLSIFPEAERILSEFGNLRFGNKNDEVVLDPSTGEDILEETRTYEAKLGRRLYPLGVWKHQDRIYLLIDEQGFVYELNFAVRRERRFHYELRPLASSFDRAVDYMVRRWRTRREKREDLGPVDMLDKVWRLEDSR